MWGAWFKECFGENENEKIRHSILDKNVSMALILIRFDQLVRVMHIRNVIH